MVVPDGWRVHVQREGAGASGPGSGARFPATGPPRLHLLRSEGLRHDETGDDLDEQIIRYLTGESTPRQRAEVEKWRASAPENEQRFREVAAVWRLTGEHTEVPSGAAVPTRDAVFRVEEEGSGVTPMGRPSWAGEREDARRRWRRWGAVAAALAAALVVGLGVGRFTAAPGSGMGLEFHTDPGQMTTATLSDGTVVRLAPSSRLRITGERGVRDVWLEGRAFFSVAHDPDEPFVVRGPAGETRVLGTRFDVENRGQELRLLVLEGRVALDAPAGAVEVTAGQLAEVRGGGVPSVMAVDDPESMVAWLGVFMAFESTPLGQVARELESRLGIEVVFTDPGLATRTVTGWFGQEVRDEVVPILCRIAGVTCEEEGTVVRMSP
jgi:transmembrane sensor